MKWVVGGKTKVDGRAARRAARGNMAGAVGERTSYRALTDPMLSRDGLGGGGAMSVVDR